MKIVQVDMEHDYGIAQRGPNYIGRDGFARSMIELGHHVVPFYFDAFVGSKFPKDLQARLEFLVEKERPDLVFFTCMYQDEFHPTGIESLGKKTKTLAWFGDDHWRFESYSSRYARAFHTIVTTDPFAVSKYRKCGCKQILLSQWAAITYDPTEPPAYKYRFDVSFIGGANPFRRWFLSELIKRGVQVATFGNGWESGPLSDIAMYETFRASRINLNLGNSRCYDARFLMATPRGFFSSMRSPKHATQIKARNFEIPYHGGFQLTDYVPGLERYYTLGDEVACFTSLDEAVLLIGHYLDNEDEREHIRVCGQIRARNEHTYRHRLEAVLNAVEGMQQ